MATIPLLRAQFAWSKSGNGPNVIGPYPEAASQSYKAGQFVYLSSGKVTACGDDATECLGMAPGDATGTTDTDTMIIAGDADNVFEVNVYNAAGTAVTAVTQPGSKYGLQVDSNKCYCDLDETTAKFFQIHSLCRKDTVGDTYGRVNVQILSDIYQLGPGEKTA